MHIHTVFLRSLTYPNQVTTDGVRNEEGYITLTWTLTGTHTAEPYQPPELMCPAVSPDPTAPRSFTQTLSMQCMLVGNKHIESVRVFGNYAEVFLQPYE